MLISTAFPYYVIETCFKFLHIRGDSGESVNISGSDSIGLCEENVYVNTCLILNGH